MPQFVILKGLQYSFCLLSYSTSSLICCHFHPIVMKIARLFMAITNDYLFVILMTIMFTVIPKTTPLHFLLKDQKTVGICFLTFFDIAAGFYE